MREAGADSESLPKPSIFNSNGDLASGVCWIGDAVTERAEQEERALKRPRWTIRGAAIAIAGCTAVATASLGAAAAPAATTPGPTVKLIAAQNSITAQRFGRYVFLDPGIY